MNTVTFDAFDELDDEIKQEFYEDVLAAIKDINECASILEAGADSQVIDRMFRALHTVKGNCNMVFLTQFVDASHKLEDLFSDIRSGEIDYDDIYGNFAVTAVNAIGQQIDNLIQRQGVDIDSLMRLENIIDRIEQTEQSSRLQIAEKAIIAIQDGHYHLELVAVDQEHGTAFSFLDATDMEFFQFIADQQSRADPQHENFILICESMALKLNAMLGRSIDEEQLKVAIIFICLSIRFIPVNQSASLSIEQIFFASGLLARMSSWGIASEVTLQINENHNGSGAPLALADEQIMPAAQALALAIEFSLSVLENQSLGYKASLFAAVKTINAKKETRFKARLIERFNQLIKSDYLNTQMW